MKSVPSTSAHRDWIGLARRQVELADAAARAQPLGTGQSASGVRPPVDFFPGYELQQEIHRGGQGVVYAAIQKSTGRRVALKVLREWAFNTTLERSRFEREVQVLAALRHPNIVAIHDSGRVDSQFYFVMDFIAGRTLDAWAAAIRPAIRETLDLFATVCDAVEAAHVRGIIHRDLKPANVIVDADNRPHVLDFGLAKVAFANRPNEGDVPASTTTGQREPTLGDFTETGQFVGSLPWAAPEQVDGSPHDIDTRSDVYSLGVVLYQLLTGRFPYSVQGPFRRVLETIARTPPVRPRIARREIDDELETILLTCLSKERERRYQSAGELGRDIRRYLNNQPIEAKRDSGWYVLRKSLARYRGRVAALAAFVLVAVASAVSLTILYGRQGVLLSERDAAATQAQQELETSSQVVRFTQEMLSGIDPAIAGELDKRLMRTVLDKAAERISTELVGQPAAETTIRATIGDAYVAINEYAAALPHFERSFDLFCQFKGADSPQTWSAAHELGQVCMELGRNDLAESHLTRANENLTRLLGPSNRDTLRVLGDLALLRFRQDRLEDSRRLCFDFLRLSADVFGNDDTNVLSVTNTLAIVLSALGEFEESLALYEYVAEVERRARGNRHPRTIVALGNLARSYVAVGRLDEAEALYYEAIEGTRALMGAGNPNDLWLQSNLSSLYEKQGRKDEAYDLLRDVVQSHQRGSVDQDMQLTDLLYNLARLAAARGDFAAAEKWSRNGLCVCESVLPAGHPKIAMTNIALGTALLHQACHAEAEIHLQAGYAGLADNPEVGPEWKRAAIERLATLYEQWSAAEPGAGKSESAAEWRRRVGETSR